MPRRVTNEGERLIAPSQLDEPKTVREDIDGPRTASPLGASEDCVPDALKSIKIGLLVEKVVAGEVGPLPVPTKRNLGDATADGWCLGAFAGPARRPEAILKPRTFRQVEDNAVSRQHCRQGTIPRERARAEGGERKLESATALDRSGDHAGEMPLVVVEG